MLTCDDVRELSGSYVLGALDAADRDTVDAHLSTCPEAHAEIAELASVLPVLDASVPEVEPPLALKSRLLAAAAADRPARGTVTDIGSPTGSAMGSVNQDEIVSPSDPAAQGAVVAYPSTGTRTEPGARRTGTGVVGWALRIAAVLAIVVLGGWNLLLQGQLDQTRTYERQVAAVLDVAGQPDSLTVVLTPQEGGAGSAGPAGLAAVDAAGDVTLAMRDLPATTGTEVYEAWVIGGDGVPVALGGFAVGPTGTAYFEGSGLPADPGIVLALTLEPAPGASAPTGPVVSAGSATSAG
jgi:anti-sigma-K factor RskA